VIRAPIKRSLWLIMIRWIRSVVYVFSSCYSAGIVIALGELSSALAVSALPLDEPSDASSMPSRLIRFLSASVVSSSSDSARIILSAYINTLYRPPWMLPCTCCQNGKTNYKYHTINSPTSRGIYRWIILDASVFWKPL
jgi:hypothetical protein